MVAQQWELESATPQDAERIATWVATREELVVFAGPLLDFPLTGRALLATAEQSWRVYVLRDGDQAAATGSLRPVAPGTMRIGRVLVDPQRRGEGWGRRIVESLIAVAAGPGDVERVELSVYDHNLVARALYEDLGFSDSGNGASVEIDGVVRTSRGMVLDLA